MVDSEGGAGAGRREVIVAPLLVPWHSIRSDLAAHWYIYASMPLVASVIGYVTKLVAIEMLYRPMRFVGVGPIGWQGLVPRRAGKVAAVTIELLTENLLRPEELLERINGPEAVERLRAPLASAVDAVARDVMGLLVPGGWDALPARVRRAVLARVNERAPIVVDRMLAQVRGDVSRYVDLHAFTVSTLVEHKDRLNRMMRETARGSLRFLRHAGLVFGFGIGLVQTVAWAVVHNVWVMPGFGLVTGFLSDWVALTLLFKPTHRVRFLGRSWQGVLHLNREQITRDYAHIMATELFEPEAMLAAMLEGAGSDRLFEIVRREIAGELRRVLGPAQPLVQLGIGSERYVAVQRLLAEHALTMIRTMPEVRDYAADVLGVEALLVDKMSQLTDEQFEGIMRPMFKDDEWLMITVGAVLGFLVGEVQVELVTRLGGA